MPEPKSLKVLTPICLPATSKTIATNYSSNRDAGDFDDDDDDDDGYDDSMKSMVDGDLQMLPVPVAHTEPGLVSSAGVLGVTIFSWTGMKEVTHRGWI
jgi:hypothetical protein